MNTNNQTEAAGVNSNFSIEHGIISIDVPVIYWGERFAFTMLKLARIITAKEYSRRNLSVERVAKLMVRHSNVIGGHYHAMDIREKLYHWPGEIRGGGFEVMWDRLDNPYRSNGFPHYDISFYRIIGPEDMVVKPIGIILPTTNDGTGHEPART